jgi:argininosuccinate lyase
MYQAAKQGYATATDLADYLVRKGLAFRDAHEVVGFGSAILGIETKRDLSELTLNELQAFCKLIEHDVFDVLSLEGSSRWCKFISAEQHQSV